MPNVRYKGERDRGPSPGLWGDLSKLQCDRDMGKCNFGLDDFTGWSTHTVNTNATIQSETGGWAVLADAGVLVNPIANSVDLANGESGVLVFADADADNDEAYIAKLFPVVKFDATYGYRAFFEARVKLEDVDGGSAILAGFALKSDIAADLIAADTTTLVATANFVGFQTLDNAGATLRTTYQKVSQTQQVISSNAATLVDNTWVKLGLLYNPNDGAGKAIRFYVDGAELADSATYAQVSNTTLFPDDISVVPFFGFKIDGTGNDDAFLDWIAWAQYFE